MKKIKAFLAALCGVFLLGSASAGAVQPLLDTGGMNFGPGETHTLSVGAVNSQADTPVDMYLGLLLPDSTLVCLQLAAGGILRAAVARNLAECGIFLSNVMLTHGLNTGLIPILQYTFAGLEPFGLYQWYLVFTRPGTGLTVPGVLALTGAAFVLSAFPVASILGQWAGSWFNQTFSSTGSMRLNIAETGPGKLEITTDLGGNVLGMSDPPPFGFTGTANKAGGFTFSGVDGRTTGTGSIGADGTFAGVVNLAVPGFDSIEGSGKMEGGTLQGDYTVNFSFGPPARGTFSATHR